MRQVIENIGKKVIEQLYDFNNNEYEYDGGCYEPGCVEGPSASMHFAFKYNNHFVTVSVSSGNYIEVLFEDDEYENLENAVNDYVEKEFDDNDWLASVQEDVRDNSLDEWQSHGFRDAADYYHYRYGA